jgi:ligand-binding SRPBCC domain-containing protein
MASVAVAADVTTSTTTSTGGATTSTSVSSTTSTGTIHEYTPGSSFVVKETSGPVNYRYGKKVTYVTKKGKTLSDDEVRTRIKVGAPVSVHYSTEGSERVIDRVEIDDD